MNAYEYAVREIASDIGPNVITPQSTHVRDFLKDTKVVMACFAHHELGGDDVLCGLTDDENGHILELLLGSLDGKRDLQCIAAIGLKLQKRMLDLVAWHIADDAMTRRDEHEYLSEEARKDDALASRG